MIKLYSIHTPPYATGRLIEDPDGTLLKLEDLRPILLAALPGMIATHQYIRHNGSEDELTASRELLKNIAALVEVSNAKQKRII